MVFLTCVRPSLAARARRLAGGLCAFCVSAAGVLGQAGPGQAETAPPLEPRLLFRHAPLPSDFVPSDRLVLAQDSLGFLWAGSADGLFRFDGHQAVVVERAVARDNLPCRKVHNLLVDGEALWIAGECGLERLSLLDHSSRRVWPAAGQPAVSVRSLARTADGVTWAGTMQGLVWADADGALPPPAGLEDAAEDLRDGMIPALFATPADSAFGERVYIGLDRGIAVYDAATGEVARTGTRCPDDYGAGRFRLEDVAIGPGGRLWLANSEGLAYVDAQAPSSLRWNRQLFEPVDQMPSQFVAAVEASGGELWVSINGGILRWQPAIDRVSFFGHQAGDRHGPSGEVGRLFADRHGRLWAASEHGLDVWSRVPYEAWRVELPEPYAGMDWQVTWTYDPLWGEDGLLWLASQLGVLAVDWRAKRLERFLTSDHPELLELLGLDTVGGLPTFAVYALAWGERGELWIGGGEGLAVLPAGAANATPVALADSEPRRSAWIEDLLVDDGRLWIAARDGLALRRRDGSVRWLEAPADGGGGPDFSVPELLIDHTGRLWVGTNDRGLLYVPAAERGAPAPTLLRFEAPDLPSRVMPMAEDGAGVLWLWTAAGMVHLGPDRRRVEPWQDGARLPSHNVRQVLELDGDLWLLHDAGISRYSPASGELEHHGEDEGLLDSRTIFSATQGPDGELILAGPSLFSRVELAAPVRGEPPPARLTDLRLRNQRVLPGEQASPLERTLGQSRRLVLDADDSAVVTLEFSAFDLTAAHRLRYAYRLVGHDDDWLLTERDRPHATYTGLDPGRYRFEVRSVRAGSGAAGEADSSLELIVRPPWWRSSLAYAAYLLAGLGLAGGWVWTLRHRLVVAQRLNLQLQEIDRLKDDFLANTSHELRTPLFGITGLAEGVLERARHRLGAEAVRDLEGIAGSSRRLSRMVETILDFAKIERGGLELERRPTDLYSVVDVVLTLSRPLAEEKGLELRNAVDPELPPADADEERVHQVLLNLVANAIKFTPAGRVEVWGREQRRQDGEGREVLLSVVDTGIGIPQERQEAIFDSFTQADASIDRRFGGAGLGLAISRRLVEAHGGRLWVRSSPERGSVFSFTLPALPGRSLHEPSSTIFPRPEPAAFEPAGDADSGAVSKPPVAARGDGGTVLVVDDEALNRRVLASFLEDSYRVIQVGDGLRALEMLERQGDVDLVVLDVMMPRMSGFEVCREIRRRWRPEQLPVLLATARSRVGDRVAGFAEGANDYLIKPIEKRELLSRVEAQMRLLAAYRGLGDEVRRLSRLLPMCASCKRIRDDEGYWDEVEHYLARTSGVELSHGICPACAQEALGSELSAEPPSGRSVGLS